MTEDEFREALRAEQGNYGDRPMTPELYQRRNEVDDAIREGAAVTFPATGDQPSVTTSLGDLLGAADFTDEDASRLLDD